MLNNTLYSKLKKSSILLVVASIIFYFVFAYYTTRTEYYKIVALYAALFFLFYKLVDYNKTNLKLLTYTAVILRLIFIFSTPNLSQDFYRFIWDGRMIFDGFNPYLYTPDSFINNGIFPIKQAQELYNGMGELSSSHYTNYPPINQLCFTIAALFSSHSILGSIISMRLIIIAADIGTLYFGKKLLERLKLPSNRIFWYILNPFIIIELTGNLHFEGVMVFFLIWAFYLLYSDKWKWTAVIFACSISVKLIPLMLLPLFFKFFRTTKTSQICYPKLITFYAIIGITILLLFLPFFSMEFVNNYSKTVGLWFGNFEFNASIYYLLRAIGYSITGYNEIAIIGKILPIISVFIIFGFSLFKQNNSLPKLITSMLLVFTCYLFLSTTVHPWYIATLVIFCVFTNYKFPLVWSFVIILSYLAYSNTSNTENLWIIGLEYLIVFSVFIWEVVLKKRLSVS
ncbi:mannosyltransferase [Winogradskyella undariae]|uniref:mannosyltransferase n=1 Tax=Winogradskyella undariae TaxID=1285465 RepID=UPI00156B6AF5|nr:mannosyltransferase [Winogradskyella undariae]NRR90176.1 mannosyltransferase [Winogradskyella undariae]